MKVCFVQTLFILPGMSLLGMNTKKTWSHSRMLHRFPLHPDAQEQVLGPTHLPLFMHIGSHTPAAHWFTHLLELLLFGIIKVSHYWFFLLTLLTAFSRVAFRTGAHVVPPTLTSVLTRRTAHS